MAASSYQPDSQPRLLRLGEIWADLSRARAQNANGRHTSAAQHVVEEGTTTRPSPKLYVSSCFEDCTCG